MDPFTISTGVAGLLSLSMEIVTVLSGYISDVNSAAKQAQDLPTELTALQAILQQLDKFLCSDEGKQVSFDESAILFSVIKACEDNIRYLYTKLVKFNQRTEGKTKNFFARAKWPLHKDECQQL
jgi:nucleoid-associated protein YejK